ncbi:GFA family protein [Paraglaciecola arctica]
MQNSNELIGQCLCKKVKITATKVALHVVACHCSMCRILKRHY